MIISKTPFRISFFGGGTDYPEYFTKHGGAVLGTAIDKFAYISAIQFYSRLFDYRIRLSYRKTECVKALDEIEHGPFRECLRWCGINKDIEIEYSAELPAFSGLGASSSFVVGLLNTLYAYQGKGINPLELAYQAIKIERDVLKEAVGCQDQAFAALGGFNLLEFRTTEDIIVHRVSLTPKRIEEFESYLLVVHTGIRRQANAISTKVVKRVNDNLNHLKRMREMVDEGYNILTGSSELTRFGLLLNEAWQLKSQLEESISNDIIKSIYKEGTKAGAIGGKLLGAGGGGFFLFFVEPEKRNKVLKALKLEEIPVKVNSPGSHVIYA